VDRTAQLMCVSQEGVRQIVVSALEKLRNSPYSSLLEEGVSEYEVLIIHAYSYNMFFLCPAPTGSYHHHQRQSGFIIDLLDQSDNVKAVHIVHAGNILSFRIVLHLYMC